MTSLVSPNMSGKNRESTSTLTTSASTGVGSQKKTIAKLAETTEEQYINRHLNHFNQFTDFRMIEEYTEFCARQRSVMLMFCLNIFFTGSLICAIISTAQLPATHRRYPYVMGFLTAAWGIDFVEVCLVWVLFYSQLVPQQTSPALQWIRKYSHHIQYAVLMCLTLGYVCRLFGRVISGECDGQQTLLFTSWNCNQYKDSDGLPMDTAFALMLTPILFSNVAREVRVEYVMSSFFAASVTLLICMALINSWLPLSYVGPYIVLGSLITINAGRQNAINFLTYRKFKDTLEENELMAAEVRANELRHMIRNVAHDLKTPLTSFMTGIDIMSQVIEEYEHLGYSTAANEIKNRAAFLSSIKSGMEDVRNTNAFMLMAVNRCMDYTKASVGLQLTPKYETIDFRECVALPLECMKNLQEKIRVLMAPISPNIANLIITDQQWLQENLLCYLSNAVKFATSEVQITISLQSAKPIDSSAKDSAKDWSNKTSSSRDSRIYPTNASKSSSRDEESDSSIDQSMSMSGTYLDHVASETDIGKWFRMKEREKMKFETIEHVILVEVEDDGMGLTETAMKSLFDPQKQAQRLTAGLGLGLYSLSKRIEALKGAYGVSKRNNGKNGSLFWFTFPYKIDDSHPSHFHHFSKKPGHAKHHKSRDRPRNIKIVPSNNTIFAPAHKDEVLENASVRSYISDPSPPVTQNIPTNQSTVLLVEGSPTIAKPTSVMLTRQGHKVDVASNGEEALKLIEHAWQNRGGRRKAAYDVILMDMHTFMADGTSACSHFRVLENERQKYLSKSTSSSSKSQSDDIQSDKEAIFEHQNIIGTMLHLNDDDSASFTTLGFDAVLSKPFTYESFNTAYSRLERMRDLR